MRQKVNVIGLAGINISTGGVAGRVRMILKPIRTKKASRWASLFVYIYSKSLCLIMKM